MYQNNSTTHKSKYIIFPILTQFSILLKISTDVLPVMLNMDKNIVQVTCSVALPMAHCLKNYMNAIFEYLSKHYLIFKQMLGIRECEP